MINTNKIKGRMREKEITQADVAKHLSIASPTANQKINNVRSFNLEEAEKLAELLDIDCGEFGTYFFNNREDLTMKYVYTDVKKDWIQGKTLYQIRAAKDFGNVHKGEMGGYIEKESNLSQDGNAWITKNAVVYGEAQIYGDALITGIATVSGEAKVYHNAVVKGQTHVSGNAHICGSNTEIKSNKDYICIGGLAGKKHITAFLDGGEITVVCDDFCGDLDEFENHIFDGQGNGTIMAEAFELAEIIRLHFGKR